VWDVYSLVNHQVKNRAGLRVVLCDDTTDCVVALGSKGGVVIKYYQRVASEDTCVSM
jgi:hypothetical protein